MNSKKWLRYYRNSIVDGERGTINASQVEKISFPVSGTSKVEKNLTTKIFKKARFEGDDKINLSVLISPLKLVEEKERDKGAGRRFFPFWFYAILTPDGTLRPPESVDKEIPFFYRDSLEPLADESYCPTFSSVDKVDQISASFTWNYSDWKSYVQQVELYFNKLTGYSFNNYTSRKFIIIRDWILIVGEPKGMADSIINIYDKLINMEKLPKLLSNAFPNELPLTEPVIKSPSQYKTHCLLDSHLGQLNRQYPLSPSQRSSLYYHDQNENSVLAVNGPPGTGKTTLLQSVVANLFVKRACDGESAPIIAGCSTNNQAITNILDSFDTFEGEHELASRWINMPASLGIYMASSAARSKPSDYILLNNKDYIDGYQLDDLTFTESFEIFKTNFQKVFSSDTKDANISLEKIGQRLKKELSEFKEILCSTLATASSLSQLIDDENDDLSLSDWLNVVEKYIEESQKILQSERAFLDEFEQCYREFQKAESFVSRNLSFLPGAENKRFELFSNQNYKYKDMLLEKGVDSFSGIPKVMPVLNAELSKREAELSIYINLLQKFHECIEKARTINVDIDSILDNREKTWYEALAESVDISFRYQLFLLSVHYFEYQWLAINEKGLKEKERVSYNSGEEGRRNSFNLIANVHPLFISTFHSLSSYATYLFLADKKARIWEKRPLIELFDLIIVDEAGQVAPEIGTYSLGLAKRAILVGDSQQIEPIWNIDTASIDYGNLQHCNILPKKGFDEKSYAALVESGLLARKGSLIQLGRRLSAVKVPCDSAFRGTMLIEHRRCLNEIIEFSNIYIYKGLLEPKVGNSPFSLGDSSYPFPPLGHINIRGQSQKGAGGKSRINLKEAAAIALWIQVNSKMITNDGEKLEDKIAVVTPFRAQKYTIENELHRVGIENAITVGTVHSLQGAEKDYILFSPVYGSNELGQSYFFDQSYNMLNVALSRAKKSFIVIGYMALFVPSESNKPSSSLAKVLFSKDEYALPDSFFYEDESVHQDKKGNSVDRISNLQGHRKALWRAFEIAEKKLVIVSPFISVHALEDDDVVRMLKKSINNNVKVEVYTDWKLDLNGGSLKPHAAGGRSLLKDNGADLILKKGIHNKALIIDNKVLVEGSFNWLSAARDEKSPYYRHESSICITDEEYVGDFINEYMEELDGIQTVT